MPQSVAFPLPFRSRLTLASFSVFSVAAVVLGSGCGTEHLPPPSPPPRVVPADVDFPAEPPPNGAGRVVIDANGERAKVVEITGSATAAAGGYRATIIGLRPLCTTPCVVDLPYGSHPLVLRSTTDETRMSELELDVGPRAKIVRHQLGERKSGGAANIVGSSVLALGAITALTGALLWGVGELASRPEQPSGLVGPGQIVTGIGAAGILLSIPLLIIGRPSERPGATTEWTLPGGTAPPAWKDPLPQGVTTRQL